MTNADCTTATFINTHFVSCYPATRTVTTFFDHYSAGDQGLAVHEWKNASCDRGGNHGDLADVVLPTGATTLRRLTRADLWREASADASLPVP